MAISMLKGWPMPPAPPTTQTCQQSKANRLTGGEEAAYHGYLTILAHQFCWKKQEWYRIVKSKKYWQWVFLSLSVWSSVEALDKVWALKFPAVGLSIAIGCAGTQRRFGLCFKRAAGFYGSSKSIVQNHILHCTSIHCRSFLDMSSGRRQRWFKSVTKTWHWCLKLETLKGFEKQDLLRYDPNQPNRLELSPKASGSQVHERKGRLDRFHCSWVPSLCHAQQLPFLLRT